MRRSRRTEITIETREHLIVRRYEKASATAMCFQCRREVKWIDLPLATEIAAGATLNIFRSHEDGEVHFLHSVKKGQTLVCQDSLLAALMKATNKPQRAGISNPIKKQ